MNYDSRTCKKRSPWVRAGVFLLAFLLTFSAFFDVVAFAADDSGNTEAGGEAAKGGISIDMNDAVQESKAPSDEAGDPAAGSGSTMPLSEIVQQVGIRDDIQVGYDQPVDGAFAVTLNDTDNGHLVFEDGRTGTKWFMPGDKVYITGVPDSDEFSLVGLSVSSVVDENNSESHRVKTDIVDGFVGMFRMQEFSVNVDAHFGLSELDSSYLPVAEVDESESVDSLKDYILDNIDSEYVTPDGSFVLSHIMYGKYSFADGSMVGQNATIDGIYGTDGMGDDDFSIFYQQEGQHPLWDIDADSEYYVGWLYNPYLMKNWKVTDRIFARDNVLGEVVDGCYLDYSTGLVYIPKELYAPLDEVMESGELFEMSKDEVSNFDFDYMQCQMLFVSDSEVLGSLHEQKFPTYLKVSGNVDMEIFNDSGVIYGSMMDSYLAVPLVADVSRSDEIDWADVSVFVNGEPYLPDMWSYDSSTGVLYVGNNSVNVQFLDVVVQEQSLADMITVAVTEEYRDTDVLAVNAEEVISHASFDVDEYEFEDTAVGDSGISPHTPLVSITDSGYGTLKFKEPPTDTGNTNYYKLESWTSKPSRPYGFDSSRYGALDSTGNIFVVYTSPDELSGVGTPSGKWYAYGNQVEGPEGLGVPDGIKAVMNGGANDMSSFDTTWSPGKYWDMGPAINVNTASLYIGMTWQGGVILNKDGTGEVEFPSSNGIIRLFCSHSSVAGGSVVDAGSSSINYNGKLKVHIRVMDVVTNPDGMSGYCLLGFATSKMTSQESMVILKMPWVSPPQDVYVEIQKEIDGKCAEGNPLFDNLSGIKFSVINKDTGELVATLTTNENGYAKSDKLKYSKTGFDIQEISIPDNLPLKLNSETQTIVIDPKENNGVKKVVIADKVKRDPLRLNIIKRLSNGLAGSLDDLANAGISVVGIPFKFEYIPDLNFTWSQAQGNYASKVHYTFQAKTVKRGNRAAIYLNGTSGCLDSSTINDLKAEGYWDDFYVLNQYAAFPPGFIVVSEMPHAGVQLLKTKMLWEIPMNGTSHWVTNNSDDDISYGMIEAPEVTVNNKYKTFIIEFPKVDKDTGESEGQGDAVLDAEFELLYQDGESEQVTVNGRKYAKNTVICQMEKFRENGKLMFRLPSEIRGPFPKGLPPGTYLLREKPKSDDADYKSTFPPTTITVTREDVEAVGDGGKIDLTNSKYASPAIPAAGAGNEVKRAGIKLRKVDADKDADGRDHNPQGNGALNAEFAVVNKSANAVKINGTLYAPNQICYRGRAVQKGNTGWVFETPVVFPVGHYEVYEATAATGYHIGDDCTSAARVDEFEVTEEDDGKILDLEETAHIEPVPNKIKEAGLKLYKSDIYRIDTDPSGDEQRPEGNASFAGAEFTITNRSNYSVKYKGQWYEPGQQMDVITVDERGEWQSGSMDFPVGTYEFRELNPPEGYLLNDSWVGTVTIPDTTADGEIHKVNGLTQDKKPMKETPKKGGLKVKKYDSELDETYAQGNAKMSGAVFSIYNLSQEQVWNVPTNHWADPCAGHTQDTMANHNATVSQNNWVMDIPTDADGWASTGDRVLPYGTYCVVEKSAPEGYLLNTSWHRTFTITEEGQMVVFDDVRAEMDMNNSSSATGAVPEAPKRGGVRIHKSDKDRIDSQPQGDEDMAQGDATLEGAVFEVYNESAHDVYVPDPTKPNNHDECDVMGNPLNGAKFVRVSPGGLVATLVTDEHGVAETGPRCLPYGRYRVVEKTPPEGYLIDDAWSDTFDVNDQTMDIIQENHGYNKHPIREPVIRGGVALKKIDAETHDERPDLPQGDATLEGAQYSIYNISKLAVYVRGENGQFKWVDPTTLDAVKGVVINDVDHPEDDLPEASCVWRGLTNNKGELQTALDLLPYGTYVIRETKPSRGYNLNNEWSLTIKVRENGKLYNTDGAFEEPDEDPDNPDKIPILEGKALLPEDVIRGGVRIEKWDWDLNASEGLASKDHDDGSQAYEDGETKNQYGQNLSSMVFGIWNISQMHVEVENENGDVIINDPNGDTADVSKCILKIVTHWDDEVKAYVADTAPDALPYGTYMIRELRTDKSGAYFIGDGTEASRKNHPIYTFEIREEGKIVTDFIRSSVHGESIQDQDGNEGKMIFKNRIKRGEFKFVKKAEDTQGSLATMWVVTHMQSGERHVIVTDRNGQYDSTVVPHDMNTNANDHLLERIDAGETINMSEATMQSGLWFGEGEDGSKTAPRNDYGALYFGQYQLQEVRTNTNEDYELINPPFFIEIDTKHTDLGQDTPMNYGVINLGTLTDGTTMRIKTEAIDGNTQLQMGIAGEMANIIDTIRVEDGQPGTDYRVVCKLIDKETGALLEYEDEEGNIQTAVFERNVRLSRGNESIEMNVEIPGKAVAGKTIVCYEIFYDKDGKIAASHTAINDKAQTVRYPEVGTTATSDITKDHDAPSVGIITLTDVVEYKNVIAGQKYRIEGKLMDKETGEPILDENGEEIIETRDFVAEEESGTVEMTFEFDASHMKGKTLVVFETLKYDSVDIGIHADLEDEGQTIWFPEIHTTAVDTSTDTNQGAVKEKVIIRDSVFYKNLVVGSKYVVKGTLMHKLTGTPMVDAEGNQITAELEFVPVERDGFVTLEFELDSRELEGQDVVVFESLYKNDIEVAVHAELKDENQTVHFPEIHTSAGYGETHEKDGMAATEVTITDIVSYKNLKVGEEYTVNGILMDKNTGGPILDANGEQITSSTTFVPEETTGTVEVVFTFDASNLEGMTTVVYESLEYKGVEITVHSDLEDEEQTVRFPKIRTTLTENESNIHEALPGTKVTLKDNVKYWNLTPGETYIIKGVLKDKDTGETLKDKHGKEITSEVEFVPQTRDGVATVVFEFDGSALAGKTSVAFETLEHYGRDVAVHADLEDEEQTVRFPAMSSILCQRNDKGVPDPSLKTLKLGNDIEFVDVVSYENLVPGNSYRMEGTLVRKSNGQPVNGRDGQPVKSVVNFNPTEPDGSVEIPFIVDTGMFAGDYIVAYQRLYAITTEKVLVSDPDAPGGENGNDTEVIFMMDDGVTRFFRTFAKSDGNLRDWAENMPEFEGLKEPIKEADEDGTEYRFAGWELVDMTGSDGGGFTSYVVTFKATFEAIEDQPDTSEPDDSSSSEPEGSNPDESKPDVSEPDASQPDVSEPDESKPESSEPESSAPESSDVESSEPEVSEPETSGPAEGETPENEDNPAVQMLKALRSLTRVAGDDETTGDGTDTTEPPVDDNENNATDTRLIFVDEDGATELFRTKGNHDTDFKLWETEMPQIEGLATPEKPDDENGKSYVFDHWSVGDVTPLTDDEEGMLWSVTFTAVYVEHDENKPVVPETDRDVVWYDEDGTTELARVTMKAGETDIPEYPGEIPTKESDINGIEYVFDKWSDSVTGENGEIIFTAIYKVKDDDGPETPDVEPPKYEEVVRETVIGIAEDINDMNETVDFELPKVHTMATGAASNDHTLGVAEKVTIVDEVFFDGLCPGSKYTLKGMLVDRSTGQYIRDKDNKPIEVVTDFWPETEKGSFKMEFEVDTTKLVGKKIVVFETLFFNEIKLVVHEDITDADQTVEVKRPELHTTATGSDGKAKDVDASATTVIKDVVKYTGLVPGTEYKVTGRLMDAATGDELKDKDGKTVTAETTFVAEKSEGSVTVEFVVDTTALVGRSIVVYEKLYNGVTIVATHEDRTDPEQTVVVKKPEIKTMANGSSTKTHDLEIGKSVTIVDTVSYKGLVKGQAYTINGKLMDKATNKPLKDAEGKEITATKSFVASGAEGSIEVEFQFNTENLAGMSVVVFEELVCNGNVVAKHEDITDLDQTIRIPKIRTQIRDKITENEMLERSEEATVVDRVFYWNLTPGTEYTVVGTLMDKATGEVLRDQYNEPVMTEHKFTAEDYEGYVDIEFKLDTTRLENATIVAFEILKVGSTVIARHEDLTDKDQTAFICKLRTTAQDETKQSKVIPVVENSKIIDTVAFENLSVGHQYKMVAKVVDKATGEFIKDAYGNDVTAEVVWTPVYEWGNLDVLITLDARELEGHTLVVYEYLYDMSGAIIGSHEDINDEAQAVTVGTPEEPDKPIIPPDDKPTPKPGQPVNGTPVDVVTGIRNMSGPAILGMGICLALAIGLATVLGIRRNRERRKFEDKHDRDDG